MAYWVKKKNGQKASRVEKLSVLQTAIDSGKLSEDDLIGKSPEGPWNALRKVKGLQFRQAVENLPDESHPQAHKPISLPNTGFPETTVSTSYSRRQRKKKRHFIATLGAGALVPIGIAACLTLFGFIFKEVSVSNQTAELWRRVHELEDQADSSRDSYQRRNAWQKAIRVLDRIEELDETSTDPFSGSTVQSLRSNLEFRTSVQGHMDDYRQKMSILNSL